MKNSILKSISESIAVKQAILSDELMIEKIQRCVLSIIEVYKNGGKVLLCGNGGSAADAQHLAAELSGRFYFDRPPLYAEALHVNTSYLTAVGNDYGYQDTFSRMIEAAGKPNDILIAFSTSGNSANILKAIETAKRHNMLIVGMTGLSAGAMRQCCDILFNVPSVDTPRIQEAHITIGHTICQLVEEGLFGKNK